MKKAYSHRQGLRKRFLAVFRDREGRTQKVQFSMKREKGLPFTYVDGASQKKKDAYHARASRRVSISALLTYPFMGV